MTKATRLCVIGGASAAAAILLSGPAEARTMELVSYSIAEVWPASVRFLRVDRSFPIHEKDESAGYVLFDYTDGPKPCRASLELIRATDSEGRDSTRMVVTIPDLPKRYERMLIDKLASRLRDDLGPPAPPPRPTKPAEPPRPYASPPPPAPPPMQIPINQGL